MKKKSIVYTTKGVKVEMCSKPKQALHLVEEVMWAIANHPVSWIVLIIFLVMLFCALDSWHIQNINFSHPGPEEY